MGAGGATGAIAWGGAPQRGAQPQEYEAHDLISPGRGDRTIARGERSEPLVGISIGKSPEGAKGFCFNIFRPSRRDPGIYHFTRGSLRQPVIAAGNNN
jgi:hypothetical protein